MLASYYYIYKHTNKLNGKAYIGQTKQNPQRRWRQDGKGYKDSPLFWAAIQKYGWDNFTHEILEITNNDLNANQLEKEWIAFFQSNKPEYGYNLTAGGNSLSAELWQSLEYRKKALKSFKKRGEKVHLEYLQNHPELTYNEKNGKYLGERIYNPNFKIDNYLIKAANKTKELWKDEEYRNWRIKKDFIGKNNPNSKKVINIETGIVFNTIKEAAKWCHMNSVSGIGQCCKNIRKTSGRHPVTNEKLHWKYYIEGGDEGI